MGALKEGKDGQDGHPAFTYLASISSLLHLGQITSPEQAKRSPGFGVSR